MAEETTRMVFYRGARSLRSKKPSYWSFTPRIAQEYAKLRGGKVFKAHILPKKALVGSEADIAQQLGIYKEWIGERTKGRSGASIRRADALLHTAARKAGADVIVHSNQVIVLNPKVIHSIKDKETKQITCKHCGSTDVVKIGFHAATQRYLCKACKRRFKADDAPFHMKVSGEQISSALHMYYTGSSITDIRNHIRQETGYYPSKSVVYNWIDKYTQQAANHFIKVKPKVGDKWIADETMIDLDKGIKVWFWDIIDADTRFLLASRVSLTRTTEDAKRLVQDAVKRAGKPPKVIITDKMKAYPDGIFTALGGYTEHLQGSPFTIATESTSRVERFHETLKERTKVMKAFRDIESLITFAEGFLTYYNFFKPHEALRGKTPAEKAKLRYKVKTWADVVNMPVPAEVERARRISPRMKLEQPKVSVEGAFKRRRVKPHQKRLPIGEGVYADRKGERLSRKKHKGWRRIL